MAKSKWKRIASLAAAAVLSLGVVALGACGGGGSGDTGTADPGDDSSSEVAGTYTIEFSTSELSGNVRHTGYLTSVGATETNTLVLYEDYTYAYTKCVSTRTDDTEETLVKTASVNGRTAVPYSSSDSTELLSWTAEGTCTFVCYTDGTFEFAFPSYGVSEEGTWTWENWTFTAVSPDGNEYTATLDSDNSLVLVYYSDISSSLYDTFTVTSSVWAAAFGTTGSYVSEGEEETVAVEELLSWTAEGTCTFVCYTDGTFEFAFPSYGVSEEGTWTWENWTFTAVSPDGNEYTATLDSDNSLVLVYYSDISSSLYDTFTVTSSVWAAAFGTTGSYTPVSGSASGEEEDEETYVVYYYAGSGEKSTQSNGSTVYYDVSVDMFLLSTGDVYCVTETETTTSISVGSWTEEDGVISVTVGSETASASDGTITLDGIDLTLTEELPSAYADADWDALVEEQEGSTVSDYIEIIYTFYGTYTADGTTVTLNPADSCVWSEDWGYFVYYGFSTNSGDENDIVYPKGSTSEYYYPLDHFGGQYYYAPTSPSAVTNNIEVTVVVDASAGTFTYAETESVFDE